MRTQVLEALANWILKVSSDTAMATAEEVRVLPEIAKVYLTYEEGLPSTKKS